MGTVYLHWPYYTMLLILVSILSSSAVMARTPNTKAASTRVNCGCQCSSLTFRDKYNRIQGNCKTSDNTGAQWCYTEPGSTCEDLKRSTRYGSQGRTWSYQACSTPSLYSRECAGYGSTTVVITGSQSGGSGSTGGSIANCRYGHSCNVGNLIGAPVVQYSTTVRPLTTVWNPWSSVLQARRKAANTSESDQDEDKQKEE